MAMAAGGNPFLERVHDDVLKIITRRVSKNSYRDLLSLSAASKTLRWRLRDYSGMLKYANVETLLACPLLSREQIHLVRDCDLSGNSEASFWLGLYALLQHDDWYWSRDLLKAATDNGHALSMYTWGIFAIAYDEWNQNIANALLDAQASESLESLSTRLTMYLTKIPTIVGLVTRRNWTAWQTLEGLRYILYRHHHVDCVVCGGCLRSYWTDQAFPLLKRVYQLMEEEYFG